MFKFGQALAVAIMASISAVQAAGFTIKGDQLIDANGNPFVIRGVNHPHAWYADKLQTAIPEIAKTGANTVRVVMATGGQWTRTSASQVRQIINICKANKMIAVLEVHDCTGYGEKAEAKPLSTAVDYWLSSDIKAELDGQEAYVILNIANEPFGNSVSADTYINEHKDAVKRLRAGGYKHNIMIDAANWGQDWEGAMRDRADEIWAADPDKNLIFSVHMYDLYNTAAKVKAYLNAFKTAGLPLVVGEFAADHGAGKDVDEATILSQTLVNNQGYMGWSWTGNGTGLESLDIVQSWGGAFTSWGKTLVDGVGGIKATSKLASIFTIPDGKKSVMIAVDGQGTVTQSVVGGRVDSGKADTLVATPATGHEFLGWSGDTAGTVMKGMSLVIPKVEKNYTIKATFAPSAGTNLLGGGAFTGADSGSWTLSVYPTETNAARVSYAGGQASITPTKVDTNIWSIQLTQAGLELQAGVTYELRLDAKSATERPFSVGVVHNGNVDQNWSLPAYFYKEEELTATTKTFVYEFTPDTTDVNVILQVNVGKFTSAVTVDNISLVKVVSSSIRPRSIGSSKLSLRSVANGFEWTRTAPLASDATVRVVDTKGRELHRSTAKAGSVSGFVPSVGAGLRFVVLESAAERDVRPLTSTR